MTTLRDTPYASERARGCYAIGEHEARIERIYVKEKQQEEIRFSWWKNGRLIPRALDVTEDELLAAWKDAVEKGVFTQSFLQRLREII